jgi:hypothetical protein
MDDDKNKAGVLPGGGANKRTPPTIDLAASEVTDSPRVSEAPEAHGSTPDHSGPHAEASSESHAESVAASSPRPSRISSVLISAVTGVVAALLVIGAATLAGWPEKPAPVSTAPLADNIASNKADIAALGTRIAKVESDAAKPAPRPVADPAIIARLDAVEKSLASLRSDVAAVRWQNEKAAAAISEIKSASPQGVMTTGSQPVTIDTSAIEERIGKIERATAALSAAAAAPLQPPAEDPNVRKMAAATQLDAAVRQSEPYASALAAARAVAGNAEILKPLDAFAATGIPTPNALCRELLTLLPKLAPKPDAQPAPSGMVERLQQSAAKLVRIQRVDAAASGVTGVLARVTAAAQRDDLNEAKRELTQLPAPDRAPVRSWIAKVDARDAALAASRQFASDTMTALSKPAR